MVVSLNIFSRKNNTRYSIDYAMSQSQPQKKVENTRVATRSRIAHPAAIRRFEGIEARRPPQQRRCTALRADTSPPLAARQQARRFYRENVPGRTSPAAAQQVYPAPSAALSTQQQHRTTLDCGPPRLPIYPAIYHAHNKAVGIRNG